jgi:plasmid maintenance system killer protein
VQKYSKFATIILLPFFGKKIYICMEIDYLNNKIKKKLSDATEISKAFGNNAKRISQRLAEIEAAANLAVLMSIPAANCHPLTGNRKGDWALDISKNHRLVFEIKDSPIPSKTDGSINTILVKGIVIIGTEDYH